MQKRQKSKLVTYSKSVFSELIAEAQKSKRNRHLLKLHPNHEAELHSMINVFCRGSYVQPHRHWIIDEAGKTTTKGESFLALQGKGRIIQFDDEANIVAVANLDADEQSMLWIPHDCWHTVLALSPIFIVFENKTGPWKAETDKAFHTHFPNEEADHTSDLIKKWEAL